MPRTTTLVEAAAQPTPRAGGTMLIQLITPGVGSSGEYAQEVLEAAAADKVFPKGTLMFADHPTATETYDRPARSIRDVAGVLVEDAYWDGTALVGEAKTFSTWTAVLTEMKDAIGVSVRSQAELGEAGASGRPVVKRLTKGLSVDFVTQAGRGGAIREVYESARPDEAVRQGFISEVHGEVRLDHLSEAERTEVVQLLEASSNERGRQLRDLIKAVHGGNSVSGGPYVYVVDYDETARTVTFEVENGTNAGTYTQSYTVTNDVATELSGDAVKVRRIISWVPVTESVPADPAGQSITQESKEDAMPTTIEESRLAQLEEASRRVPVLETELAEARQVAETSQTEVAEAHREADTATAARIVAEADYNFNALESRGLLAELPRGEDGRLDVTAFTTAVAEAVATAQEARGVGNVTGLGSTTGTGEEVSEDDFDARLAEISKGA